MKRSYKKSIYFTLISAFFFILLILISANFLKNLIYISKGIIAINSNSYNIILNFNNYINIFKFLTLLVIFFLGLIVIRVFVKNYKNLMGFNNKEIFHKTLLILIFIYTCFPIGELILNKKGDF